MGFSGTSIQGHLSRGLIDVMRLTLLLLVSYRPLAHLYSRSDLRLVRGTCGLDTFAEATVVGRVHKKRAAFIGATASVPEEPTSPESAGRDRAVIIGAPVQRCQRSESGRTQRCRPSRASAS